jgi:hypothetical protein
MGEPITAEEVHLDWVADAAAPSDKLFVLTIVDLKGREFAYQLDGLQVADLMADADRAGVPPHPQDQGEESKG